MTKHEFLQGYGLLTIQPWGKLYRGNGPEATIQMELYYRQVSARGRWFGRPCAKRMRPANAGRT